MGFDGVAEVSSCLWIEFVEDERCVVVWRGHWETFRWTFGGVVSLVEYRRLGRYTRFD